MYLIFENEKYFKRKENRQKQKVTLTWVAHLSFCFLI
jgi:hypothetical protein